MRFFSETKRAVFLSRPNRFTVYCNLEGKRIRAFLPNPGRLQELLLPGATLFLEKAPPGERSTSYTAVAVQKDRAPVVLHTHKANAITRYLLERGRIPGLEGARVTRAEVTRGKSRFDFLLSLGGKDIFLEVKSCTLFSARVAMFPDAVTSRGRKHIEELAALKTRQQEGAVLFLVHHPRARVFLPDYHTDPEFAKALMRARNRIRILPVAIEWKSDLSLGNGVRLLDLPWSLLKREASDRGCYLLLLRLRKEVSLEVGSLGRVRFRKGYYIYVGSAMANLSKRLVRHRRLEKKRFWHIDTLREAAEFHAALPILTGDDLECELADALRKAALQEVPRFGSSDCTCPSHLFRMETDPLDAPEFHAVLQHFRMERLMDPDPPGRRRAPADPGC